MIRLTVIHPKGTDVRHVPDDDALAEALIDPRYNLSAKEIADTIETGVGRYSSGRLNFAFITINRPGDSIERIRQVTADNVAALSASIAEDVASRILGRMARFAGITSDREIIVEEVTAILRAIVDRRTS